MMFVYSHTSVHFWAIVRFRIASVIGLHILNGQCRETPKMHHGLHTPLVFRVHPDAEIRNKKLFSSFFFWNFELNIYVLYITLVG